MRSYSGLKKGPNAFKETLTNYRGSSNGQNNMDLQIYVTHSSRHGATEKCTTQRGFQQEDFMTDLLCVCPLSNVNFKGSSITLDSSGISSSHSLMLFIYLTTLSVFKVFRVVLWPFEWIVYKLQVHVVKSNCRYAHQVTRVKRHQMCFL